MFGFTTQRTISLGAITLQNFPSKLLMKTISFRPRHSVCFCIETVVAGFRWPDWRHVEGSVLDPQFGLWTDFLLRDSGSFSCFLFIFFQASEYVGSPSLFCWKRESGLDSMNSGGSFWKGKRGVTGRGNLHGLKPMAVCLMSRGRVIQPGYQRAFYLWELGTAVSVNGELRCRVSGSQAEDSKEIREWA